MDRTQCLAELLPGDKAKVIAFSFADRRYGPKLTAFGLLPGIIVEMMQTMPCYVLRIGHTQMAFDQEIARAVIVETLEAGDK